MPSESGAVRIHVEQCAQRLLGCVNLQWKDKAVHLMLPDWGEYDTSPVRCRSIERKCTTCWPMCCPPGPGPSP